MNREISVWISDESIGALKDRQGIWQLHYTQDWLSAPDGFDLSPALARNKSPIKDGSSNRPVQWFFDNLLPEEGQREAIAMLTRDIDAADAFGLLEVYGKESFGALSLLLPGEQLGEGESHRLTDAMLQKRIEDLPYQPLQTHAPKKMSLAGAQHKLPVIFKNNELFEPAGALASTHILKPEHQDTDRYPHSVANEYFCMRLADQIGLPVPKVYFRNCPAAVFIIKRFDRDQVNNKTSRLHSIDACQLLNLDRRFKYTSNNAATLRLCIDACRGRAVARQFIFRWMVFNLLITNNDAHLKNLSFLVDAQGVQVAPAYDLLSTCIYPYRDDRPANMMEKELPIQVGSSTIFGDLSRNDVLEFAEELGLDKRVAARLLDRVCTKIEPSADALLNECVSRQGVGMQAGEMRLLRTIRYSAIREMRERLMASQPLR